MKQTIIILLSFFILNCSNSQEIKISQYHKLINEAELFICSKNYQKAVQIYAQAFKQIDKPFGKDVFNAALSCAIIKDQSTLITYLKKIVNNLDDLSFVESVFVDKYLSLASWNAILKQKSIAYNPTLRQEFVEILERDQQFRPMYETHDDTINANRKINLKRILEITDKKGFPSHQELGYTKYLKRQNHDIVLHHTAQRRSGDKTVMDLEPLLKEAVNKGRFDPERAIFYLNFQNDLEKGIFEVYSSWQYMHPLLPDSLNKKVWFPNLNEIQLKKANAKRKEWHANNINDIALKVIFLTNHDLPFLFSAVSKTEAHLSDEYDKETVLEQYLSITKNMTEFKN
jgi:hypothetical protein